MNKQKQSKQENSHLIGKTITIKDHTGEVVTRRVLGIDLYPKVSHTKRLNGEHFVLAGPDNSFSNRTYASTDQKWEIKGE